MAPEDIYRYTIGMFHLLHLPPGSLEHLVALIGYPGIFIALFAETGLFFGFFLPGSSMLFTAGLLASHGVFDIWTLTLVAMVAAILGDNVGYWFGSSVGHTLFTREDSRFFKKHYVHQAHAFYQRYGMQAVIIARFIPIVRTFVPIIAGIGEMNYTRFVIYNVIGGTIWAGGTVVTGYYLGKHVPWISTYFSQIILAIIIITSLPLVWEYMRHTVLKKRSKKEHHSHE